MAKEQEGKIVQIIGPVIDVEFQAGHLPNIYNALHIVGNGLDVITDGAVSATSNSTCPTRTRS